MLGAVTTLVLAALFYLLVSVAIDPLLYAIVMGGGRLVTSAIGDLLDLVDALSFLFHLTAMLLALMAGSLVASGSDRPYPGFRSAASATLVALCASAGVVLAVALWLQQPVNGPAEAYTRSETLGLVQVWIVVGFIVLTPVTVLAGYLGGRFGQMLLRRIADR
ncbi:hypothetical protein BH24ACT16_BH24ACT16_01720 [soil metagenome]